MSGRGRAAVAGDSQGDGGRSRPIGWEAGAEGPLTAFRATLVVRLGTRLGSTIKWGILIVRNKLGSACSRGRI